ncbi:Ribonuclease H-like domain containing protein [Elaphomyces granulatus]
MELRDLSGNWKRLQETLKKNDSPGSLSIKHKLSNHASRDGIKRRKIDGLVRETTQKARRFSDKKGLSEMPGDEATEISSRKNSVANIQKVEPRNGKINEGLSQTAEVGRYVAIDCEMIGVGPNPDKESALARVSIVNWNGDQVYDSFVRPKEKVTDWRTRVSGVSAKDMAYARSLEEVQRHVADIIEDTVLIGHAIKHDLNALLLSHPKCDIRDTSRHPPYRKFAGGSSPRLKVLAAELLGLSIQEGAHSSVEDARVTMLLFRRDKEAFDREHAKKWPVRVMVEGQKKVHNGAKKKKKKKKSRKR